MGRMWGECSGKRGEWANGVANGANGAANGANGANGADGANAVCSLYTDMP